jgi:hypothetical protein
MIVIFGEDPKNLQFKLHKNFESWMITILPVEWKK